MTAKGQNDTTWSFRADTLGILAQSQMHVSLKKGIEYCELRLKIAEENTDAALMADTWKIYGNLHWAARLSDMAEEYYHKAIHIYDSLGLNDEKASVIHNLGVLAFEENDTSKCINYYKISIKLRREFSSQIRIGDELCTLGAGYLSFGDYKNSMMYLLESLEYYADTINYPRKMDSYAYLADNFLITNPEKSREWIDLLINENETLNSDVFSNMINIRLCRYYLTQNNIAKAEENLMLVNTDKILYYEMLDPVDLFSEMSMHLKASENHTKALRYMALSRSITKKQMDNEIESLISNYKTRLDLRSSEEEIEHTTQLNNIVVQRIKIEKNVSYVFYLALIIISILILNMLYSYFSINQSHSKLKIRKERLQAAHNKMVKYQDSILTIKKNKNLFFSIIAMKLSKPFDKLSDDLKSISQHVEQHGKNSKFISLLNNLNIEALKLEKNLKRVLLWSKLQRNMYTVKMVKINVSDYFHELLPEMLTKAMKSNIKIRFDVDSSLMVQFDRHSFKTIIRIFTENSFAHSGTKSDIILRAQKTRKGSLISLTDFGKGIPGIKQNQILDINTAISPESGDNPENLGLGLLIAKLLAEKNNSYLSFESKEGSGTTFFIHIKEDHV